MKIALLLLRFSENSLKEALVCHVIEIFEPTHFHWYLINQIHLLSATSYIGSKLFLSFCLALVVHFISTIMGISESCCKTCVFRAYQFCSLYQFTFSFFLKHSDVSNQHVEPLHGGGR